jgi:hypothetical protein
VHGVAEDVQQHVSAVLVDCEAMYFWITINTRARTISTAKTITKPTTAIDTPSDIAAKPDCDSNNIILLSD